MTAPTPVPLFLDGPRGRLFALDFQPEGTPCAQLIFLPPFCEEMNRCRHLVAEQARRFATAGYACLLLDPYGTGDSEGELAQADWEGWRADVLCAADWCRARHDAPLLLWGLRLGALLALDLATRQPGQFRHLLLWQPVTAGKTYMTQVLRARIAWLSGAGLPAETTDDMRHRLATGQTVEVAGYVLGGELVAHIDRLQAGDFTELRGAAIHWLQQSTRPDEPPPAVVQKVAEQLRAQGNTVTLTLFNAPPLWQLSERVDCAPLLDMTSALELV